MVTNETSDIQYSHQILLSFFKNYLPYLSSIHEKANYIAIFWIVRPDSLGSCHFEVSGSPVVDIKVGRPVECHAQGHKRAFRLVLHNLS